MTKHPEKILTWADLPKPVPGAATYSVSPKQTQGFAVLMFAAADGYRSTIEHKQSQQAALRCAIRYQKRENAVMAREQKRRQKNVGA